MDKLTEELQHQAEPAPPATRAAKGAAKVGAAGATEGGRQRRAKAARLASFDLEASALEASYVPRPRSGRLWRGLLTS